MTQRKKQLAKFHQHKSAINYAKLSGGVVFSSEYFSDNQKDIIAGKFPEDADITEAKWNKETNGVTWELESESKRLSGNFHVVYDTNTKLQLAYGLTKAGAEKIAKTSPTLNNMHVDDYATKILKLK